MNTYDINILGDLSDPAPDLTVDGTCIAGIAKLVQKIMIILLSDENTDHHGTYIPSMLVASNVPDSGAVENIFNIAMTVVSDTLKTGYTSDTPEDERLKSYKVLFGDSEEDAINVKLEITAVSGESTILRVPQQPSTKES